MGSFITPNRKQEDPPAPIPLQPPQPQSQPFRKLSKKEILGICIVLCIVFIIPTIPQIIIYKLNSQKSTNVNVGYDVIRDKIQQLDESTYKIYTDKSYIEYTNVLYSNALQKQFLLNIIKNTR